MAARELKICLLNIIMSALKDNEIITTSLHVTFLLMLSWGLKDHRLFGFKWIAFTTCVTYYC